MDNTSITLLWDRPATPGRNDLRYRVEVSDTNGVVAIHTFLEQGSNVTFPVTGLTPDKTYIFEVVTRNGVSQFDEANLALRKKDIIGSTTTSRKPQSKMCLDC